MSEQKWQAEAAARRKERNRQQAIASAKEAVVAASRAFRDRTDDKRRSDLFEALARLEDAEREQ